MKAVLFGICFVTGLASAGCSSSGDDGGVTQLELTTRFFAGSYELSGTVTFAQPVPKGTRMQLMLTEVTGFPSGGLSMGNEAANQTLGSASAGIPWAVHSIAAGEYWVSVAADINQSNWIDEGDSGGYYGGTTEQPIQLQAKATKITVTSTSLSNLDFGAGPIRCLAQWGDSCTEDSDCRGASCAYPNSMRVAAVAGSCADTVCATPSHECPEFSGAAGTLEPSDCFGGP